jgi:hypothetical protein
MAEHMDIPKARLPWFMVMMMVFALAVVVLTIMGFIVANPMR